MHDVTRIEDLGYHMLFAISLVSYLYSAYIMYPENVICLLCLLLILNSILLSWNHYKTAPKRGLISDHIACNITYQITSAVDKVDNIYRECAKRINNQNKEVHKYKKLLGGNVTLARAKVKSQGHKNDCFIKCLLQVGSRIATGCYEGLFVTYHCIAVRHKAPGAGLIQHTPGTGVIKLFSYSTQLSMKFILRINDKMPTDGILTFIAG